MACAVLAHEGLENKVILDIAEEFSGATNNSEAGMVLLK
jgi:hypothetical protein